MSGDLVRVSILGMPLDVMQRSSEHSDELLREFALIRGESAHHVPARLLALIEELRGRFGSFSEGPRRAMDAALARGDETIDLHYDVPPTVAAAARQLGDLLDEADEFCRSGDLLTLATLPEGRAFRHWYLEEFQRQIDGLPPRSWSTVTGAPSPIAHQ
jgi:ketosteroid isomerase-like protein